MRRHSAVCCSSVPYGVASKMLLPSMAGMAGCAYASYIHKSLPASSNPPMPAPLSPQLQRAPERGHAPAGAPHRRPPLHGVWGEAQMGGQGLKGRRALQHVIDWRYTARRTGTHQSFLTPSCPLPRTPGGCDAPHGRRGHALHRSGAPGWLAYMCLRSNGVQRRVASFPAHRAALTTMC